MSGTEKAKERPKMKRLIKRLIEWLETNGISEKQIIDCIKFITQ